MKVFIQPQFEPQDTGEGGIRRVVEAQMKYLPTLGIHPVSTAADADICIYHGGTWVHTNKPTVVHCHGLYWQEYEWSNWAHDLNKHVVDAMKRADVVTAPSKWVAHILQRGMLLDPPVLYHGVDVDEWTPAEPADATSAPAPAPYVLWNKTRIDPICTPEPLNRLASMARDVPFVTTFGDEASNVLKTGKLPIEQAKQYIRQAGIYLCTTRETFGIGTLEAMACEVPILGWRWGGQLEIVEHGVNGYLANPGDYDDLLQGLRFCLENRAILGKAARQTVLANFAIQSVMERYATVYRQLMRRSSKAARAPRVSVVITCYNLANALPRAVASVTNQVDIDQSDVEIVIVNDNSPDDTADVAAALAAEHKNVKVVTNSENLYLSGALNAGIGASTGRYIVPLDADNELGYNALSVLADALDKDVSTDIVYGRMQVIDEAGVNAPFVSGWPGEFNFAEQMRHRNQLPSTSMYRRRVWERTGGYRRRCHTAEDADFWCRATSFGFKPRKVTDAVTLIYHDRSDSMSHVQGDWDWTAWYSWSKNLRLTPFGAAQDANMRINVPTYQPSIVTAVIPVGPGHGKYVIDAVDSLIAQTHQNWACIVVNDSGEELPWLPPFVKVLSTGGKVGPANARNIGIAATNTHLFLPLDADDYLQPDAIELMLAAWQGSGDSKTYVYSDFIEAETGAVKQVEDFDCARLAKKALHSIVGLYPKAGWIEVGGFDGQLNSWEDWDFSIALAHKGYCGLRVPHPLFYYRMRAGGRRETMYSDREVMATNLSNKWPKFLLEGDLMGCGCGGGRSNVGTSARAVAAASRVQTAPVDSGEMVLLEFVANAPARTYRGQASGKMYRFGGDAQHKIKYVDPRDVPHFLRLREFKKADTVATVVVSSTRLEAKGPPVHA